MVTNFLFVPIIYFCYPETAQLTLEEIDYIFADETKSTVKWSMELRKQKLRGDRKHSLVDIGGVARRASGAGKGDIDGEGTLRGSHDEGRMTDKSLAHHEEKV